MLIKQKIILRADLQANPRVRYIFGDNEARVGLGGQAREMRGERNAIGVATLAAPGRFWSEEDSARQIAVVRADFKPALEAIAFGETVVYPTDGIGTGLARLQECSPSTFAVIREIEDWMERVGNALC